MQVSNATLFSAIGSSTAASKQTAEQYLLQPVTIEGQIVEDEQKKKSTEQIKDRDKNLSSNKERDQQQSSNSQTDESASSLLIQAKLNNSIHPANSLEPIDSPEPINSPELTSANNSDSINGIEAVTNTEPRVPDINSFPFSNRRSFNGLAGESLVLQSYLNNEPEKHFEVYAADSKIDIFI